MQFNSEENIHVEQLDDSLSILIRDTKMDRSTMEDFGLFGPEACSVK